MVSNCLIQNCKSSHADQIGFFRFPLRDKERTEKWMENLKNGLPADFELREKDARTVCAKHFESGMIRAVGRGFRLAPGAVPILINSNVSSSSSPNGITKPKSDLKVQKTRTASLIIASLQRKIVQLEAKLRQYKKDPPDSLIFAYRHKLYKLMDRDAVILFESCLKNQGRASSERRHSSDSKRLASRIYHTSYETYRFMQPIFKLPSARTIDRHDSDRLAETVNKK